MIHNLCSRSLLATDTIGYVPLRTIKPGRRAGVAQPSFNRFTSPCSSPLMCHWRRVRNHYKRCNHYLDLPDEMIQCDDRFCKFSTCHPRNCVPPRCTETCWQYRQFPQQFTPVIDDFCPSCIQSGRGQPTGSASKYA